MKQKIFLLDNKKQFKKAENFKSRLENDGLRVICHYFGFDSVIIKGFDKNE